MTNIHHRRKQIKPTDLTTRFSQISSHRYVNIWLENIHWTITLQKVDVKVTLLQALRLCTGRTVYWGSRGIDLLFRDHGTRRGEGSASRPGRSSTPGKTRYLYRRLGGTQGRSGQVRKISPTPGFDPRNIQPVASHYSDWAIAAHITPQNM